MRRGLRAFAFISGVGLAASVAVGTPIAATDTTTPAGDSGAAGELAGGEDVTLSLLIDDTETTVLLTEGLTSAFSELHPNVSFDVEQRPGGADGDNIVKTRLATDEMADVFFYNSGSLLQALNPAETLVDLAGDPMLDNVVDAFIPTVSQGDGVFGVPFGSGLGGGILYRTDIFEEHGLSVPTHLGGVRRQQRSVARGRGHPGRRLVRHDVDVAAVRARRLLQRRPGGARLRRAVHGQRGPLRRHTGRTAQLRTPAGGLRQRLVERGLRLGDV